MVSAQIQSQVARAVQLFNNNSDIKSLFSSDRQKNMLENSAKEAPPQPAAKKDNRDSITGRRSRQQLIQIVKTE